MTINILRQYGFNFSKIPTDLQEAISVLSQKTNGSFESDNEKLNLLDETVFNSIKKLFPDDESVILTTNLVELIDSSIVNNGFNTIFKEDMYNDNFNTKQQIYAKNGLALNEEDMENNGMPGGLLVGNSHTNGGIKIKTPEGEIEAEGGEVIINKRVLALDEEFVCAGTPKDITSKINEMEGGVSWSDKGSCRIVKKAANGIDIESDIEINKAEEGVAVQYSENGKLFIVEADTEEQAELIEDAINEYREGFIEKEELENTLQSYMNNETPSGIEVIGGIKHVKSDFYQGWIPFRNQEPINIDSKAEKGTALKNGKVSFKNISNGTWAFEYDDNGIKAYGIVKKNEKIGEFDYVIEDTYETFDKDNRQISSGIYKEVGAAFSNSENRFMKTHKKAAWGWNILGAMGERSHEKDNALDVNAKLIDLDVKWEALRDEYRHGGFTTEEYFENKKELLAEYEPFIERALKLGIAVNQGILWGVKVKAERGTEVNPTPKPADVRPGMYKVFSLTNSNYPEWTGDVYNIKKYIKESSDFNEEDWEESLYKLGLTYSELPTESTVMAANGYFRSEDKEKRPSPSISAKIYPAGYRMEGNDGNIWEISVATNGVHRWVKSHKSVAADGTEINRVEDVSKYISIGFAVPKDYKPAAWAKAKRYMDQLVELGYVTKNDLGRGKGKYWTNDKSDALTTNLSELCNKLAEILIDSGKIKAEHGIDIEDKDGKVVIIEAYDTNEKGDDKEQLWLYLGQPNAQFKVVYTVTDMEHIKEDVLSEKGTAFVAEKLEDVVFTDEDGNEAQFGLDEEISAMEDITALFKKYIEGQTWEDKPSSVKMNPDEILKAANGVIISSSCGCQHKAANGAKIEEDIESKINELYTKSKFINDDFNWKNKLLEMLQDKSIESYEIYQSLSEEQKEEVLQELFTLDNDMGSYGDGEISTSKENLDILLADSKNGKKYTKAADGKSIEKWDTGAGVDIYSFMEGDEVYLNGIRNPFGMVSSIGEKNVMVKRHSDGKIVPMSPTKLWVGKNIPQKAADGLSVDKSDWIKNVTHDVTSNGVPFTEEIVSHKGASFTLFPISDLQKTSKFIDKAKSEIRHQRDAVSIKVADDNDWDELYKTAYFRDARTKSLKWFQIEQDEKLIRSERKKGTTPTEFVDKFVLPFTKETEKKFRDRSGDKIDLLENGGETRKVYVHSVNRLDNKKEPVKIGGHTLVYQKWSKVMGGNGVSGTIIPQNYYVATIDEEGKISFEDLESNTKDIDKEEVTKQWYWKNIVEHFDSPYFKEKSDWKENGSDIKSEAEMRAVYMEAFGQEFDSPLRKQAPLPIEVAYKVALNKLDRMAANGKKVGSDWSRIEQNEKEFEAAMKHLGIPKKDWEKYRNDFAANGKKVNEIVVTKMSDIENIEDKINEGKVTYRGLGMGKLSDDFYKLAGENGKRIKVDGKEYFVTDSDYRKYEWDEQKGGWKNKIKFNAPYRKFNNGGGIVNENDDMELWFSPGGQIITHKPKGTALHIFEDFLTQKIGASDIELTESNDHEYVYQIIGNTDRINQKITELDGFEVETYGMQKRVHIPTEIVNQVVLSMRYPLMTPYAEGGPVKDWTDNLGVTNEDLKWIDQIEKEHIEEDIIWLFYENFRSAGDAEKAKNKTDIKKYETKVIEHNGKYWLFFKMNFGLEAFERIAAANGIMVDEEVEERTEEFTSDEDIEKHGTVFVSEWNKYNDLYKDKIEYAEYEVPEAVAVFEGKTQYSRKFFKMYGTIDHIKKAFEYIEFNNKLATNLADEKEKYPELTRPKDLKVYALNRASYVDGYKAYANGGTIGAEHEAWVDQHLTNSGFDVNELTPEQKSLILQPTEAPEVYSQDGEIRSGEAMSIWLRKIAKILKGSDIKKAVRANFAADGKSITVYDEVRPTGEFLSSQILRNAVRIGAITIEQANSNSNIRSIAREVAQEHRDDEEIGSSDMTFILKEFLDGIGLETYFGGNSGSSLQFKGDVKMKNGGGTYPYMSIGVIEPKPETIYTRWHPPIEVYQYANKIWAKSNRDKRIDILKKYVSEFKNLDLTGPSDKNKKGSAVPDLNWRNLSWGWQRDIATGLHNSNFGEKMENGGFVNREHFYMWDKPELRERTKNRLTEISDLGMTEVGDAQFGIKDIMSGLYIEMVWSYTDEEFKDYMDWVKSLIREKGWVKPEEAANGAFVKMGDGQSIPLKLLNQISKELYNEGSYYTLDKHDHNAATFVVKEARARMEAGVIFNEAKERFPNTLKNLDKFSNELKNMGINYTVSLSAEPNPDYDQDSQEGSVNIPEQLAPVKSISEARDKVMQFISEFDLGSGNWSGGQIFDTTGKPIAFISYNGKVWEGKIEDGSNKEFKY